MTTQIQTPNLPAEQSPTLSILRSSATAEDGQSFGDGALWQAGDKKKYYLEERTAKFREDIIEFANDR